MDSSTVKHVCLKAEQISLSTAWQWLTRREDRCRYCVGWIAAWVVEEEQKNCLALPWRVQPSRVEPACVWAERHTPKREPHAPRAFPRACRTVSLNYSRLSCGR